MSARIGETITISSGCGTYRSHPSIVQTPAGEWLLVYSQSEEPDGGLIHPPNDPRFINRMTRSIDEGRTWGRPRTVPGESWTGVECSGLTALRDGTILLNQFRFDWRPVEVARGLSADNGFRPLILDRDIGRWRRPEADADWAQHPLAVVRADDGSYVHRSVDGAQSWETTRLDVDPYQGAFSPKGGIELENGEVILALGSHEHDPLAASVVTRSLDSGQSWGRPEVVACLRGLIFSEPTIVAADATRLLVFSREETSGYLYESVSDDRGMTWGPPIRLLMWGHPGHAIQLRDGRIVLVYGHRRPPFGVRACLSGDFGRSWGPEFTIRTGLNDSRGGLNFGYPSAIEYRPGELFVAYYAENGAGTVGIHGTYVAVD